MNYKTITQIHSKYKEERYMIAIQNKTY